MIVLLMRAMIRRGNEPTRAALTDLTASVHSRLSLCLLHTIRFTATSQTLNRLRRL